MLAYFCKYVPEELFQAFGKIGRASCRERV